MPPPIDRDTLNALLDAVGGDPEFLAELLEEYFKDAPAQFQAMQTALSTNNADVFRRAAHSMKSNSANFGALALAEMCKNLEEMGKTSHLTEAASLLTQAEAEYQHVKTALEMALKEL